MQVMFELSSSLQMTVTGHGHWRRTGELYRLSVQGRAGCYWVHEWSSLVQRQGISNSSPGGVKFPSYKHNTAVPILHLVVRFSVCQVLCVQGSLSGTLICLGATPVSSFFSIKREGEGINIMSSSYYSWSCLVWSVHGSICPLRSGGNSKIPLPCVSMAVGYS